MASRGTAKQPTRKKMKTEKEARRPSLALTANVTATRAKNEFGSILEQAIHVGPVAITRHDVPKAVLIPFAEYELLQQARSNVLEDLEVEFEGLLTKMQAAKSKRAVRTAFAASPLKLSRAAVKHALKKR